MNAYDKTNVIAILQGRGDNFTSQLFRLIAKADNENAVLLAKGFPEEVLFVRSQLGRSPMSEPASINENHLIYLDELRESGQTNMFGAIPYLQGRFGMERKEAREILKYWMESFEKRHPN